jgi:BlaI family penicillinase repressor
MAKKKPKLPRLPEGEIEILEMLWRKPCVTIQQAQQALGQPIGYTTVQTRLNRLVEKGVVHRTTTRPAQYSAAVTPDEVRERDLETLVDRVSSGRVVPLVAHLIDRRDITREEIAELKQLISQAEERVSQTEERVGKTKGGNR